MLSQLSRLVLLAGGIVAPLPLVLHLFARRDGRSPVVSPGHATLAILVLWVTVEALIVAVLGWAGHVSRTTILALEIVVAAWGLWLSSRERGWDVARLGRRLGLSLRLAVARPPHCRALLAVAGAMALLAGIRTIAVPVADYDSLMYQLPRVVHWSHAGTFRAPMPPGSDLVVNSYPYAWNTLFFLGMVLVGHDQFILLANIAAWLMLGLAIHGLGRQLGGGRLGSLFAAVLVLLMPATVMALHTAHVDLPLAAMFLAGVYFSVDAWHRRRGASLWVAAICAALVLGTKMSGVVYAGLLGGLWSWLALCRWGGARRHHSAPPAHGRVHPALPVLALATAGLLGASWYVQNALTTGNPLGFMQVSIAGHVIWDGPGTPARIGRTNLLHNFHPWDSRHWSVLATIFTLHVGLPGVALGVAGLGVPRALLRRPRARPLLVAAIGLCLASLYVYVAGPWSAKHETDAAISEWAGHQTRYSLPFWALLAAVGGAAIPGRPRPALAWAMVATAAVSAVGAITGEAAMYEADTANRVLRSYGGIPTGSLTFLACAAAALFAGTIGAVRRGAAGVRRSLKRRLVGRPPPRRAALVAGGIATGLLLVTVLSAGTILALRARHRVQDRLFGGIARYVDRDLPGNAQVGFWGTHKTYLLYGKRLDRRLHYVGLDAVPDRTAMVDLMRRHAVGVLAVGPRFGPSPVWDWLADPGSPLERLHGSDLERDVVVYRASAAW